VNYKQAGVDISRAEDALARIRDKVRATKRPEVIGDIGADTLGYLSLEGMVSATGGTRAEHCTACFTGDYLVPVQLELEKGVLEKEPA